MTGVPSAGSGHVLWAFAAGAGIPVMAALNGALSKALGGSASAVVATCLTALLASAALLVLSERPPSVAQILSSSPALWCGGLIVAFYLYSVARLVPALGASGTILAVMLAQSCTSAVIDHYGLLSVPVRRIGVWRIVGLSLIAAGFAAIRYGDVGDPDRLA